MPWTPNRKPPNDSLCPLPPGSGSGARSVLCPPARSPGRALTTTRLDLPYLFAPRGRSRRYWYYRRGARRLPIAAPDGRRLTPDDPGFLEAYERIHASFEAAPPPAGAAPGSLAHLVTGYLGSPQYAGLSGRTRKDYRTTLDDLARRFGRHPAAAMTREFVINLRDRHAAKPSTANEFVALLRLVMNWGMERPSLYGVTANPAAGVRKLKEGTGHRPWEEWEIAAFRAAWPGASWERVAFELLLNTGQRLGDVRTMTRNQVAGGWATIPAQNKTGARVEIPIAADLAAVLEPWLQAHDHLVVLPSALGTALNVADTSKRLLAARRKAGLPDDLSNHGLRYTAGTVLREIGTDWPTIADVLGHATATMARKYSERRRRTRIAITRLDDARRPSKE